jgi:hypothetical protein
MIKTYNIILDRLAAQGIKPKHQMLDNEASKEYLKTIEERGITWELAPPGNHRRNVAERMIQTGKNHITSNLIGCDESFPMREWDRLLPQMELTLNMLRPSHVAPTVSAHSYVFGIHDYNKMPLGPLGCKTQCFVSPEERRSFGTHSIDSWYIGTSPDHYRCHKVFVKETKAVRITDTLLFHHKEITQPTVTVADALVTAAAVLAETVKTNMAKDLSKLNLSELERLSDILHKAALKTSEANVTKTAVPTPRVNKHAVPTTPRVSENISPAPPRVATTTNEDFDIEDAPNPRVTTHDCHIPSHKMTTTTKPPARRTHQGTTQEVRREEDNTSISRLMSFSQYVKYRIASYLTKIWLQENFHCNYSANSQEQ